MHRDSYCSDSAIVIALSTIDNYISPIVHPTIDSFDSLDSQADNITFVMVFQ